MPTASHSPGAPPRIQPETLADYLGVMAFAMFQAGISWRVVETKWDGIRDAFAGFEPRKVASMTEADVDCLAADPRVIRNRRKLDAVVANARELLALDAEAGGFRGWLRGLGGFAQQTAALKQRFKFLGDTGAYYFLYVIGEEVPPHEEWRKAHPMQPHRK